ncbi:MAG: hypothetical protein B9S32_12655 [Verrucomicrobia bacterium Tous-C9LFEB]|nr:MAG: hypothetical protein B9S32_12655 [Verrucomicrobia bacterium Tous-C9LFEB]
MARPPKIPNLLRPDQDTIYFLTICVQDRIPILNNQAVWNACLQTILEFDRWHVFAFILMPDHVHALVAPYDRDHSVSDFSRWFKVGVRKKVKADWRWQEGSFDRLLRHDESASEKWEYMRHNPVRAGLVQEASDWPYQIGLHQ